MITDKTVVMMLIEFFMISIFKFVCNPDFNAYAKEIDLTDFHTVTL
jgi:hypothetical protein